MNSITVIYHHDTDRFLQDVKVFDVCSNPFQSFAFLSVFLKYYPKGNFYYFYLYEGKSLLAIIPMECTVDSQLLKTKYFRFIGYRQLNYEQYICKDEDIEKVHAAFLNYLASQDYRSIVNFYDINDSTELFRLLSKQQGQKVSLRLYQCPCLHFSENFDSFFKEVYTSSKKRTELKKFQKKLCEIGNFQIINVSNQDTYNNNKRYLDQIYRVHAERFAKVYATSFFGSPKMRPYYSDLIASLMRDEKGYISLLIMDDIVIAFIFCLTNGGVLIDWIPAFDPAYSKYSLGIVQYKMLFEEMCNPQLKYKVFDYSKGSSVYKRKWAKEETTNYQFLIKTSRQNVFSSFLYSYEKCKFKLKCYLREKGVLEWVKDKLGVVISVLKRKENTRTNVRIEYVVDEQKTFNYSEFIDFPIEVRQTVLEALYQGYHFAGVETNKDSLIIKLSKQ